MSIDSSKPETWKSVFESLLFSVKINPREPGSYCVVARDREAYLSIPRGCPGEIALADDKQGKGILERLAPYDLAIFQEAGIRIPSVVYAIRESYRREEEAREGLLNSSW